MKKQESTTSGLGFAAPSHIHQEIVMTILRNYFKKCGKKDPAIKFGVNIYPEEFKSERIPDVSLWYEEWDTPRKTVTEEPLYSEVVMTIEITHTPKNDEASRKSIIETFDVCESLRESFMYNYEDDVWTRYTRANDGHIYEEIDKDYSRTLGKFMHTFLTI